MRSLQKQMNDLLKEYGDEIIDAVDEVLPGVCKQVVNTLKASSPRRTGKYAEGWTYSKQKGEGIYMSIRGYSIHNKDYYYLTHLLEYGHASRDGGRVKSYPHIAAAEEDAAILLEEAVRKAVTSIK